jgi:hypothetical protein
MIFLLNGGFCGTAIVDQLLLPHEDRRRPSPTQRGTDRALRGNGDAPRTPVEAGPHHYGPVQASTVLTVVVLSDWPSVGKYQVTCW